MHSLNRFKILSPTENNDNNELFFLSLQVWFKNRRAKWRKQKREEQERLRKLQEEHSGNIKCSNDEYSASLQSIKAESNGYSDAEDSSDLEVA